MWTWSKCYILLVLLVILSTIAPAQSIYGQIRISLTLSTTGQPLSKAEVLISSLDRGAILSFSAQTDDSGQSTFNNVPPGAYKISMKKDGCHSHEESLVPVSADNSTEINVNIRPGDPSDVDKGDGSAVSILKLDRADVATSFNRHELDALPIYEENVSRYELLVPGAVQTRSVLAPQQNPQAGIYTSLSGQHFSGTSVTLDGTVDRDPLEGIVVLNPSLDSVSELKITTQNYGAEFGPATGGIVSIQTRAGTNQWHGSLFGYRLSGFGEAETPSFGQGSFLQSSTDKFDDFGASVAGPVLRDRLFLFGDYRGIRQASDGTVLVTVPTQSVRSTCTLSSLVPCNLHAYAAAGAPFKGSYSSGYIPTAQLSPEMVYILQNFVPPPNYGPPTLVTNNYLASGVDSFSADNFDMRADYVLSNKLRLFARYSFANFGENGTPTFGANVGGLGTNSSKFAGVMNDRNQGISAGFTVNISPTLLTDFRFGFFRYNLGLHSPDTGTMPVTAARIAGLNLGTAFTSGMPDIQLDNPNVGGLPIAGNLDFTRIGYSPIANTCDCPLDEREQQFQFVDNWTKTLGRHSIRWGVDFRYLQNFRLDAIERPAGYLEFGNGAITGFSLGDFLIGALSSFSRSYHNPDNSAALNAGERENRWFLYGEDNWKVNSRLTVNYGLRWEIYVPQSVTGPAAGGWLDLGSGATPFQDQFMVAGEGGANLQGGVKTSFNNFGPRVGMAYLVNPKAVIRAGYGRMFDPGYAGTLFGIAATQSPPVGVVASVQNGFAINSQYSVPKQVDVCEIAKNGCAAMGFGVPKFIFPPGPSFTVRDIYSDNTNAIQQQANFYALPRRLRLPTVDAWNLALQEQLDKQTYLELSYVANKGTHVLNDSTAPTPQVPYYDLNEPTLVGFIQKTSTVGAANCQNDMETYCKTLQVVRQPFTPLSTRIFYYGNNASSNYNSLQVKVRRQFSSGFSLLANYTWSKVIDFDNLYYAINPSVSRGAGNFDRRHNFVMTNIWDLPIGKGHKLLGDAGPILNRVAGGWSLAAVTYAASGLPFTPTYAGCNADVGTSAFQPCRPNIVGAVHITGSRNQWFTTTGAQTLQAYCDVPGVIVGLCPQTGAPKAALQGFDPKTGVPILGEKISPWQRPGAGQIGDAGRNSLRGPGFFQSDLSVAKNIPITQRVAVQFRADAYNVFNKVNLGMPNTVVDGPSGGQITSLALGAIQRQMEFSLRVNF